MDRPPAVSVVVPVRNEASTVERAVRSALDQRYDGALEVVVADGMSSDGTREVLAAIADPRLKLVDNPSRTTPAALNAAIGAARGEVIVRCDGHSFLPPGYVARAVETLIRTGADNVGGMQVPQGRTLLQRAIGLAMTLPLGAGGARFHVGGPPGPVDTVYLGVFRREALARVGGFDQRLLRNQDSELNHRIRASGGVVYFDPQLRVSYEPRSSLPALWRQYFGSGVWKRRTFGIDPRALRPRQAAPPALVLGLIASAAALPTPAKRFAPVVPALYGVVVIGSAARAAARTKDPAALLLPVVMPVMHVAWGAGFLFGRVRPHRKEMVPQL